MSEVVSIDSFLSIPGKKLSIPEYREWITEAEASVCSKYDTKDRHTSIGAGFKLEHAITPGLYTRELTMTKGSLVFSRIHKHTHPYIMLKGKMAVYDGEEVRYVEAPFKGVTEAGTKRVAYIEEDVVWITFHPTSLTSIEEVDKGDTITCDTFEEFEAGLKLEVNV
ncbi:hypothetical protein OAP25_02060 [Flavobacteriaceae bacterium]|nr:hypothetical protein [Flavobacteriaceae bacterium]